jgi:hypothetical protein
MSSALIGTWHTGVVLTNPSNGDVLVDTGLISALRGGYYLVGVVGSASVAIVYDLQLRNAANDTTVQSQRRRFAATDSNRNDDLLLPNKISIQQNERLRCVLVGGITGEVQLSLFKQEIL